MFLRLERGSSIPLSRQLAAQIRAQCLSGALAPGSALPSVRQLAQQLAVNVNTVFRVYEKLAAEQLIEMRHGDGTYVSQQPAAAKTSKQMGDQRRQYAGELEALVRRGLLLGLSSSDLREMLASSVAAAKRGLKAESSHDAGDRAATQRP